MRVWFRKKQREMVVGRGLPVVYLRPEEVAGNEANQPWTVDTVCKMDGVARRVRSLQPYDVSAAIADWLTYLGCDVLDAERAGRKLGPPPTSSQAWRFEQAVERLLREHKLK